MPLARRIRFAALAAALSVVAVLALAPDPASGAIVMGVTDTADRPDRNIGDGQCRTAANTCTLRAAIQEANALLGQDTINLPPGVYELENPTVNEDSPTTGDHDITDSVTIVGTGAGATFIDGGFPLQGAQIEARGIDRLFEIHPSAGSVTFRAMTIREGFSDADGGAIQNWSPGLLRVENVHVLDSYASADGGGINNGDPNDYEWTSETEPLTPIPSGRVEIVNSKLAGNSAGLGAAVNNTSNGTVSIVGSQVVDNPGQMIPDPLQHIDPLDPEPIEYVPGPGVYEPVASAITNKGEFLGVGTIRIIDSIVSGNYAPPDGAGVNNLEDGNLVIEGSTFSKNTSEGNGGAIYISGGKATITGTTISENLAHADGGGVYSAGALSTVGLRSKLTVTDTTITKNEARAGSGGLLSGGDGELLLTDVDVTHNKTGEDHAGGIYIGDRASATLTDATVTDNRAYDEGGGLFTASERPIKVLASEFLRNTAGVPGLEGNDAGGGGVYTEGGPIDIRGATISGNSATGEGGGISIDNHGDVDVVDTTVGLNSTLMSGGGVENSGAGVVFERVTVTGNKAVEDGGGIHNSSSGEYKVLDTTIKNNKAKSGGGFTNASDSTLIMQRTLIINNVAKRPANAIEDPEDGGLGGGFYSISDGGGKMENTTISHNTANVRGGGMFHDADASFKIANITVWRNSAPFGGGISTVESDFVPSIPPQPNPLTLTNSIVGGSLQGGACDAYVTSLGGNIATDHNCFISVPGSDSSLGGVRDRQGQDPQLDAIADNGGYTLTHASKRGSFAVDGGVAPCAETDQRGVERPQNGRCDVGAYEFVGDPPDDDFDPPDTEYLSGPIQVGLEANAFYFTGSDDQTVSEDLIYECRLVEHDLTEAPEPVSPFEPVPPELVFNSCASGWQTPLFEEGLFTFEVRAIDRAGNVDPTPAQYIFNGTDLTPPDTFVEEGPPAVTSSRAATFTFSGTDNHTPARFLEFECRLDSRDPELWLECLNPTFFSNLTTGEHVLEVRAIDGGENFDRTPFRYRWTVGQPATCNQANITLTPNADGWVDEVNPTENYLFETELTVNSGAVGDPNAQPPEPVVGQNARTLVRFPLNNEAANCRLESATLRMYSDSNTEGRILQARPLAGPFKESTLTWSSQPGVLNAPPAETEAGEGYREWNVLDHVNAMFQSGVNHGWQIRDKVENDPEGGDQSFASRETPQDPPDNTLPELKLRYVADADPPPVKPELPPGTTPTTVHCGMTITDHTLVANDLFCPEGEGLVVGRSNIVLDLNGHTIEGPDYLLENVGGQEEGFPAGIRVSGRTNVVVRNGTVQKFGWGVLLSSGTTHSYVEDLTILRNAVAGVELFDADDGRNGNKIEDNRIEDNELGVLIGSGSENSVVRNNQIAGNLGEQVYIFNSDGHLIENNSMHGIPSDPLLDSDGGVMLEGSSDNVMRNNTVRDTGDAGVVIHMGSHRNVVEGGEYYRNGDAGVIVGDSERNKVIGITSHQQSDGGVVLGSAHHTEVRDSDLRFNPSGVEASNSNGLHIEGNNATDSLQTGFEVGNGVGIKILNNVANSTGGAGIGLEGGAFDSLGLPVGGAVIMGNETNENGESGISAASGGHRIDDNEAHNNAGFGIAAEDDAISTPLSNKASGNAEPEQCTGVVCDTGGAVPLGLQDVTAPQTLIDEAPTDPSRNTSPTFRFSANDVTPDGAPHTPATGMVFECRLDPPPDPEPEPQEPDPEPPDPGQPPDVDTPPDGEGWAECVSPITFHDLDEGRHHFEVRALDQADLRDQTPAVHEWTIEPGPPPDPGPDAVPPETRIASGPANPTTSTEALFRFAGTDNATPGLDLRFECRLDTPAPDTPAFESCATPRRYENLGAGLHTFEVRAIDFKNNADPTPAVQTWTIQVPPPDVTPPDTSIDAGPDRTTVLTHATFDFSSPDTTASFECSLNGGTWTDCASPKQYTGLTPQLHELRVRAKDPAGNIDASPASYQWRVSEAPVPTFVFCGQKLTRSTLVRNDLTDCLFDGLVIGAHGITVDLDGHTIDGKGLGAAVRNDGYDHVTVKGGKVVDYDYGIALNTGTTNAVVENMTFELTQEAGVGLGQQPVQDPSLPQEPPDPFPAAQSGVDDNIVRNNSFVGNSRSIYLTGGAKRNLVRGNSIQSTSDHGIWLERAHENRIVANVVGGSSGAGIGLEGAERNVVVENQLESNNGGIAIDVTSNAPAGVPSNDNRVERNHLEETGGIEIAQSHRNHLIDNVVLRATESGVSLYQANDNVVRGNDLTTNKAGIDLTTSSGNHIEANDASDSESTGISLESQSFRNVLLRNTSSNNDGDGIYEGDEAPPGSGTLIEGNRTHNNKGMGIYVGKPAHIIKGNSANDNGYWGIYASDVSNGRTNVDAGGNRAMGNVGPLDPITLQPQQCHLIQCAEGPPISADTIPPETTILEGPSASTTDDVAIFRFAGTDNVSSVTFQCSLDDGAFAPCTSPATFDGLLLGEHDLKVRAVDASGNVDPSPATHSWTVGEQPVGTPPETTIDSGPDLTTVQTSAQFEFSASERNASFQCRLDAAAFAPCAWTGVPTAGFTGTRGSISYTGLSVGTHTFEVRATDLDNNTDATPAVYSWRVTPAPVAAQVGCGEFVVHSIRLTNDLLDCPGHGLIVGAHSITIDLDGHVIDGTGIEAGIVNNGFDSVTVTNGHIHEFDFGVQLNPGTSLNVVSGLRVEMNQEAGIGLSDADQNGNGNTIRENTIVSNSYGVALFSNTRNTLIRDNAFAANQADGVHMEGATANRVVSNEIVGSSGAGVFMQGGGDNLVADNELLTNLGGGVSVGEELIPSNNNRVEHNIIEDSGGAGLAVNDSNGTQLLFNDVRGSNGPGAALDLARNSVVRGNDLRSNAGGIDLSESVGNRIELNNAGGTLGAGIALEGLSFDNDVIQNIASGNNGEGIAVSDSAPAGQGNVIERNTADSNGGDGILVDGAGHTLKANSVQLNGGWGIYAPVGAIDGGGNFAAGNVEPGQCFGIVCTRGSTPGAPDTWFVDTPPAVSHSRNASFTYLGRDDSTPLVNLVFECRLDSTNDLAWEDCEYPHEITNLSPGQHTLEIRALDLNQIADDTPAKYTWTYQPLPAGVAPQVTIDMKPEAETWALDALFTFHANEPDVTFQCKVDLNPWENCGFETVTHMNQGGFEWGLEETEVGPHTFFVRATDFEGNVGAPATHTWRLLGAVTQFLSGPGFTPGTEGEPATGGEVQSTEATIAFEANVSDATFECSLDLEPFTPCTSPVHYTGLYPGSHELRVIATDTATGVEEAEPATYEWEIVDPFDSMPPETTLERAPANGSSSTIFEFAGTDDLTPPSLITFECRVDSTSDLDWEECVSPYNLLETYTYADPQLAPGPHVFEVRANDNFEPLVPDPANPDFAGNVDPTPVRYVWTSTADGDAPGTGILAGPSGRTAETEATFEFFGTDNATPAHMLDFECSLDTGPFEPCSPPETVSVEPGTHTFRIRSVDLAGNPDATPAIRTWEVVPAPTATITSGPEGRILPGQSTPPAPSTQDRAIFTFTADQPDATFECALDGAEFDPCTSPYAAWLVADGTHEFQVRAVSSFTTAGGEPIVQDPATSYQWRAAIGPDTTRPDTQITSGPSPSTLSSVATFRFTGSDNRTPTSLLTFECALDPGAAAPSWNSCTSPEQFSDLTHGPHELLVRARDVAGNFDATPARYTWSVVLPPVVTITSGPEELTSSTSAEFTFTSNTPGSTFKCWLDGAMTDCTSPKSYSGLAAGDHLFAVLATSPAGHTSVQWEEYEWTIGDTVAPITTFHSGPELVTEDTRAEFTFSANKPNSTFTCSLDGGTALPCTSPLVFGRLHPGQHRLEVVASSPPLLDPLGRPVEPFYEPVPAVYEWQIVDTVAPIASIDWGPRATTASVNAIFGLSSDDPTAVIECSLDGQGFSECDPVAEFTDLVRGPHTLRVRAVDLAGNVGPVVTHAWTITDPPPPNTPVGTNVTVPLPMPDSPLTGSVNFAEVSLTGYTGVEALAGGPPLPPGFSQGGGRFYEVSTTAEFGEPMLLCLAYDPSAFPTRSIRLLQSEGAEGWIDATTTNNPFTGQVCAAEASIGSGEAGIFAIAAATHGIAPFVSIVSGPPPVSNSSAATFEFFVDQPDSFVTCSIDGLPFEPCESPKTYTHLEEGGHEFQAQAIGPFGIPTAIPTLYEWEVVLPPDSEAPDTTITKGPPALTGSFINLVEFTGSDNQTHELELEFECRVDNGPWESCEAPHEVEVLERGTHRVEVRAVDISGNVDPTPAFRNFTVVDVSAPDTSIDSGPQEETTETTATFTYSGIEENTEVPVTEFECSLDGADFVDCSEQPYTVTGLTGGPHLMEVRAKDPDGNVDPTPDFYEWLVIAPVDTTPPDTIIFSGPAEGSLTGPDATFGFIADELASEFECSLDNGPFESCEGLHQLIGLSTGQHTLAVRALDLAVPPNVDPTPATRTWNVLGEPDTQIDSHPPAETTAASGVFTFSSDQTAAEGVTFECSVDGSLWVACTSPFTAGPLAAGDPESGEQHEFEVRAVSRFTTVDGEPIVDQTPATYTWTVFPQPDPPAFDTIFTSTPPAATAGGPDAIFLFSFEARLDGAPTNLATFECSLDGGAWEECEPPYELDGLDYGEHELRVRAVDPSLQPDASPATFRWTIEDAPETRLLSGTPAHMSEADTSTATFTFDSPDGPAGTTFECARDTTTFTPCSSPLTYTDVPYGEHELQIRAKSPAGSVDETPVVHEWFTGDGTPPVITSIQGPAGGATSTTATFTWTSDDPQAQYLCTLTGAPDPVPASHQERFCDSGVTYENLAPGLTYTFTVEPTKPFMLSTVSPEPAEWEFSIVDETPPETTIESGPAAAILPDAPALFTFSSNEQNATFECALDGADFGACESPADYTGLEAGEHILLVRAVDLADPPNVDPTPAEYSWTVIGPPTTTITSGPPADPDTTTARSATFVFESDQQNVTFRCSLDGADSVPCTSPYELTGLAAGPHELEIQGTNEHGMVEQPAAAYAWTIVDGDAPETTIELGPPASTFVRTATFTFSSNEADATFECALDTPSGVEPSFGDCAAPPENTAEFADLLVGSHNLLVRAVDPSGNFDQSPESYDWTVVPVGAPNTPVGTNVTVTTESPDGATTATATFGSVTAAGFTSVETLPGAAPLPLGYVPAGARYYDVSTTATWNGDLTVCLTYSPSSLPEPVRLLHFDGSVWVDVTTTNDPVAGVICGEPGSLSAFAIASAVPSVVPDTSILSGPAAETTSVDASFEFDSNAAPVTYECALDTAPGAEPEYGSCEASAVFRGLLPGAHELLVRAKNEQGTFDATPARHSWTIVSLDTTIVSGPEEATESTTAEFEFSSDFPGATFECLLDDAVEWSPCNAHTTYTGLILEEHELLVRARTPGGAVDETPAEWSWEIGDVPPPVTIDSGPGLTTESRSATFTFSAPEAGITFECSLDGAPFQLCASPKVYNSLALGSHTLRVQVFSPNAIVEQTPATYTWDVVDQTAPQTTIDFGPAPVTGNPDANIEFSSDEQQATFECSLNGADFAACDSPASYSGLTPGDYTFRVRAVDASGNPDASPATREWRVVERPDTTIDTGPESEIATTSATFTFSSTQPGSTFECSVDGGSFEVCSSPHEVTTPADGDHTLFVRARNADGVEDDTPAEWDWTVDAAAPQTTIASGPDQSGPTTEATFTFASSEAGVTFECSLDGAAYAECESPFVPEGLTSGERTLSVRAIDGAGNVDQTPATYTWTYDGTAPQTTIDSHPGAASSSTSASFGFSAGEAGASFECSLDGAAFSACTSPKQYSGLAAGAHEFRVRATDAAGNTDASPATHTWSVDSTPPATIITDKPAATTQSTSASFGFASNEQNAAFECSLDGGAYAACSSPKEYTGLGAGEHTFRVRAVDAAGNVEPEPESHTWTVQQTDTTPPQTSVNVVPETPTQDTAASFEFTSNEAGATFECSLDGAAFTACTSPHDYTGLADGQHEFRARATDAAGNVDQTPASFTWRIDTTAPQTTIGAGAPPATGTSTSATFNFTSNEQNSTFECSIDGGAFAPCTSPRAYSNLSVGTHEFRVRATDEAENVDQTPATHNWTITQGCAGSTVTLGAAADSWVLQSSATQNYGTDSGLKVDTKSGANARALYRFNLPAIPAGCQVTSAKLRLYATSYKTGRTLQASRLAAPWTETGVNWSNQPATTGTAATVASGSGYREWTVTQQVQAMYAPNANHGFLIRDATENGGGLDQVFHSREKGTDNPPRLVLTFGS